MRKLRIVLLIFSILLTFFPHIQATATTNVNQLSIGSSLTKWVLDDPSNTLYAISETDKKLFFINSSSLTIDKTLTLGGAPTDIIKSDGNLYVAIDSLKQIIVVDLTKEVITQTLKTTSDPYQIVKDGDMIYYTEKDQWCSIYAYNLQTNLDQKLPINTQYQPALEINTENHILYIGESGSSGSHLTYYSTTDNTVIGTSNYNNGYGFPYPRRSILFDGVNVYYAGRDFSPNDPNRFNGNFGNNDNVIYVNNNLVFTNWSIYNKDSHVKLGEYGYTSDLIASSQNSIFIYSSELSQIKRYDSNQINSSNIISLISGIPNQSQSTALSKQINDKTRQLKIQSKLTKWVLDEPTQTLYGISTNDKSLLFINSQTLNLEKVINFASNPTDIIKDNGKLYVALDDANQIAVIDMASRTKVDTLYTTSDPYQIAKDGDKIYYAERDQWCDVFAYDLQTNLDQKLPINTQYEPALAINTENHILYIGESGSSDSNLIYYSTTDNKVIGTSNGFPYSRRSILFNGTNVYYAGFAFSSEDLNKMYNSENLIYAKQNFLFSSTSVYDEGSNVKLGDFKNKVDLIESNSNSLYTYNQALDVVEKYSNNSEQLSNSNIGTIVSAIPHDTDNTKETASELIFSETGDQEYSYSADLQGSFENNSDLDYYKFTLNKNGKILVQLSQLNNVNMSLNLTNSKDEPIQSWELEAGDGPVDIFHEGLAAGTYYVKLYVEDGSVNSTPNNYGIKILHSISDFIEKEVNNDLETATWMTLNRYYTGFTDVSADDFYKIKTTANGKLTVRGTRSPNVDLSYVLLDSNMEVIEDWTLEADSETDGSVENIFTVGVKAGFYYLIVTHDYDYDEYVNEEYMAQAIFTADNFSEQENNEDNATATPVLLKRTYNGMLSWEWDVDTYKVYLPCTANITLSMSQARGTVFKATIFNSANKAVKIVYTTKGTSSLVSLGNVSLPKGTYYVTVEYNGGSYEQIPYKLHLQPKVIWGKIEYRYGMSGKAVALTTAKVYKIVNGKFTYVKSVAKGSESAVYGTDRYGLRLGNGLYLKKNSTVRYDLAPNWVKNNYYLLNR